MIPYIRSNADDDLLWKDTWSGGNASNLPTDSSEQYHFSDPFQDTCNPAFLDTTTHTTPSSVPSSADPITQCVLPSHDAYGSAIISTAAHLDGQEMFILQDENSSQQGTTTTGDWIEPYPFSETNRRGLSPAADFNWINMVGRVEGVVGDERSNCSSQVVKVNGDPGRTSNCIWNFPGEIFSGYGLENLSLSKRKRLPVEPRNHARGWHCPICSRQLKRRDYIKPHVKRKHPERYGRLYWAPRSNAEQSIVANEDCTSANDGILASGLCEGKQRPMLSWDPQLEVQTLHSIQSRLTFIEDILRPQKTLLDSTVPDGWENSDGSENETPSRFKPSHDDSVPSLACPFYKHYPLQHWKCLSRVLRRPKDVKQHIYRSHTKPEFYCARCYHIFRSATERDTHCRETVCDTLDSSLSSQSQGINKDQRKLLSEKSPRDLDVEAQWFQIYGIIFPDSELPRSAYVGNCLEEMVPLLREKWDKQGYNITSRAVGNLCHRELSSVMDLFFRSLEGEEFENEPDNSSTCEFTTQSQMEDNNQQWIGPVSFS